MIGSAFCLVLGVLPFQEPVVPSDASVQQQRPALALDREQVLPGQLIHLSANFLKPSEEGAADTIEIHAAGGGAPLILHPPQGGIAAKTSAEGQPIRSCELLVPELAVGTAKVFWNWGGQVAGPASLTVHQEIQNVDWEKASMEQLQQASVLIQTSMGDMVVDLFAEKAPKTTRNFLKLSSKNFYDGLIFHRVLPGKFIQGGDPTGTGKGGAAETLEPEFNDLPLSRGMVAMARFKGNENSASSQFFIVQDESLKLDRQYTVFGKLSTGLPALERCASVPTDGPPRNRPQKKIIMDQVRVIVKPKNPGG